MIIDDQPDPPVRVLNEMGCLSERRNQLLKRGLLGLIPTTILGVTCYLLSNQVLVYFSSTASALVLLYSLECVIRSLRCGEQFKKLEDLRQERWRERVVFHRDLVAKALMSMHALKDPDFSDEELKAISAILETWGVSTTGYTQGMLDDAGVLYYHSEKEPTLKEGVPVGVEQLKERGILVGSEGDVRLVGGVGGVRYFWSSKVNDIVRRDNQCPTEFNPTLHELGLST